MLQWDKTDDVSPKSGHRRRCRCGHSIVLLPLLLLLLLPPLLLLVNVSPVSKRARCRVRSVQERNNQLKALAVAEQRAWPLERRPERLDELACRMLAQLIRDHEVLAQMHARMDALLCKISIAAQQHQEEAPAPAAPSVPAGASSPVTRRRSMSYRPAGSSNSAAWRRQAKPLSLSGPLLLVIDIAHGKQQQRAVQQPSNGSQQHIIIGINQSQDRRQQQKQRR